MVNPKFKNFAIIQGPALGSMDTSSDLCELASMWTVDDRGSNITTTGTYVNRFLVVLESLKVIKEQFCF